MRIALALIFISSAAACAATVPPPREVAPDVQELEATPQPAPSASPPPATSASAERAAGEVRADAVIANNRWRFKARYRQELKNDPHAEGIVRITFVIDGKGAITKTTVASTTASPALTECTAAACMQMRFAEAADGKAHSFTVPVVFGAKKPIASISASAAPSASGAP